MKNNCAKEFLEMNKDVLKGRTPTPIYLKLPKWKMLCPSCFAEYKNNGICENCGLKMEIYGGNNEKNRYL